MFAQFFISPLLKEDAVDRELNAIESEFQLSKNSDECRHQQLLCHDCLLQEAQLVQDDAEDEGVLARKQRRRHPFSNFSWGNKESLRDAPAQQNVDVMAQLRNFYNAHYYAQNMSLVIIGAYPLDRLEKEVKRSCFVIFPNQVSSYNFTNSHHLHLNRLTLTGAKGC